MTPRVITVTNNKGGVGKTTTVVNLAAGLGLTGRRVLVIDADPQANTTFALLGAAEPPLTLYDSLVTNTAPLARVVMPTTHSQGVALVPGHINLSAADITLAGVPGRERLLWRRLKGISGYDYVLIDTPPSLGVLTVNSLTAAGEVIIPVSTGTFALMGIRLLEETIEQLRENLDLTDLRITGAVATLYDRTRVAKDTIAALGEHFGDRLFRTVIPKNKDIEEAHSRSTSIFAYAPESQGGQAYWALTREVMALER
jgi:chromosome partitioning protein